MGQTAVLTKPISLKQVRYIADLVAHRSPAGHPSEHGIRYVAGQCKLVIAELGTNPNADVDALLVATGVDSPLASGTIKALLAIKPSAPSKKVTSTADDTYDALQSLLQDVPDGFYALPRKADGVWDFFEVRTTKAGRWVIQLLGGNRKFLPVPLQCSAARAIGGDQKAAALAFANETKRCPKCHTRLTHPRSLAARIGKTCAKAWGWSW